MVYIFWISSILCLYTYVIFPLLLLFFCNTKSHVRESIVDHSEKATISVIVPAYNEEKVIRAKIENCLTQNYPADRVEFLFGSDGSTDMTNSILKEYSGKKNIKTLLLPRSGKSTVIRRLMAQANGEIIVLSDATSMLDDRALEMFNQYFHDDTVGAVGVIPEFIDDDGNVKEGAYEKFERVIKVAESSIGCVVGLSGSAYAVRRCLIDNVPNNIINDDFYISTLPALKGMKTIVSEEIRVREQMSDRPSDTYARYVRMSVGNVQFLALHRLKLLSNIRFAFIFISHRLLRWMMPLLLIATFISNLSLLKGELYSLLFLAQLVFYLFSALGFVIRYIGVHNRILSTISQFVLINSAYLVGILKWCLGRYDTKWDTVR